MNKKEREQLLRDTLDQCLSGLDDLPSDRAEVNRRLTETMPEAKRRIRFRRLAVPAAALALCVCLIVTGTHLGMIPWPDRIRPRETKVTAAPAALAQPTGEGTGTPEPAGEGLVPILSLTTDVPLDRIGDIDYQTASFFACWQQENLLGMRSRTGIQSDNPDYTPAEETFRTLVNFYMPETLKIESISGTENDLVRTVTAVCGMKDSFTTSGLYRFRLDFTGREGERLLDFRSLHSFDQLDPDGQTVVRSVTWPYLLARSLDFDLADSMVPLNLVSEKEGIRFEVISAAAGTDRLLVVWSLQGPEGSSGSPFLASVPPDVRCGRVEQYRTNTSIHTYYDESAKISLVTEEYHFSGIDLAAVDSIPLSLDPIPVLGTETIDLLPYYEQYSSRVQVVNTPVSLAVDTYMDPDTYFRELPRILDYTVPLDIPLTDHVRLGGIGDVDGHLHVQLHYVDNDIAYPSPNGGGTCLKSATRVDGDRLSSEPFRWCETGADFFADGWIEYVFQPAGIRRSIPVTIITADRYIAGGWSVEIPLSAIRAAEPAAEEAESVPTPEPIPVSETALVDILRVLCPDCPEDFMPVGLSCEQEGFRMELVSASVKEQSAFFIFSLEDLEGGRITPETDPIVETPENWTDPYRGVHYYDLLHDAASQKWAFAAEYEYDSPDVLLNGTQQVMAELPRVYILKSSLLSIGGLLGKYGGSASLVDVPQLIPITFSDLDGSFRDYGTSWYRDQGIKVLDYTHPLSVRLHSNLELSGIGLIDGLLHVQLHYVDNVVYKSDGSVQYRHIPAAHVDSPCEPFPAPVNAMQWDTDGDGQADFIEYVFSCQAEEEAAKGLTVFSQEILDCIEGPWTIKVPLSAVWTGNPDALKTEAPGPETTPEPEPEPTPEPEPSPEPEPELNLITRLQQSIPDCLTDVVPVGLSCEQEGFRLEVVSASVKETAATFIFSLQDLEGDRLSSGVLPYVDMPNEDSGRYGRNLRTSLIYDPSSRKAYFAAEAQYDSPEILLDGAQQISLSVADLLMNRTITLPLGDFLSQYGDRAALVDLPDLLPGNDIGPDGEDRVWTTDDYRKLGWKVLDYTHPLSVRLHKNLELSGIGVVDGQLHVQLRYLDNQTVRMGRYTTKPISFLYVWRPHESDSPNPKLEWDTDGDGSADFVEFVYPCESEADVIDDLEVVFDETLDYVEGNWTIEVPLEAVWTGDQEDIATRLAEFISAWNTDRYTDMLELCSPAWISAQENPKQVLFMILQNRTPSSFTVESVSGSPGDTEREITATVSMYYNDHKPEVPIRVLFRMVQEDNRWYVDPESLITYKMITTLEPEPEPSPEPEP